MSFDKLHEEFDCFERLRDKSSQGEQSIRINLVSIRSEVVEMLN